MLVTITISAEIETETDDSDTTLYYLSAGCQGAVEEYLKGEGREAVAVDSNYEERE